MLVLSRKAGQVIKIDDRITVTVTRIKGNQVRIGIQAPREVAIRRGELQRNREQNPAPSTIEFGLPFGSSPEACAFPESRSAVIAS